MADAFQCAACGKDEAHLWCTRCKLTRYCSEACQVDGWKRGGHRAVCVSSASEYRPDGTGVNVLCGDVRFRMTDGRRSVTAACDLKKGELILSENAMFLLTTAVNDYGEIISGMPHRNLLDKIPNGEDPTEVLTRAVNMSLKSWELKSVFGSPSGKASTEDVRKCLTPIECMYTSVGLGVAQYRLVPWFERACSPSAVMRLTSDYRAIVQLVQDVSKGEMVTVSPITGPDPVAFGDSTFYRWIRLRGDTGDGVCYCSMCGDSDFRGESQKDLVKYQSAVARTIAIPGSSPKGKKNEMEWVDAQLNAWTMDLEESGDFILKEWHFAFYMFCCAIMPILPQITTLIRTIGVDRQVKACAKILLQMQKAAEYFGEKGEGMPQPLAFQLAACNLGGKASDPSHLVNTLLELEHNVDNQKNPLHAGIAMSGNVTFMKAIGAFYPGIVGITKYAVSAANDDTEDAGASAGASAGAGR